MKENRTNTNRHPLIGTWEHPYFLARWIVSASDDALVVEGVDSSTGEKFKISKLSWTSTKLKFSSLYPPTGRVVSHECRALSKRKMKVTLTYNVKEIWVRSTSQDNSATRLRSPSSRSKRAWLVGKWSYPDGEDPRALCTINLINTHLDVRVDDIGDRERSQVTQVRWNSNALSFKTMVPSTGQVCYRVFESITPNTLKATMRFRESDIWERFPNPKRNPAT